MKLPPSMKTGLHIITQQAKHHWKISLVAICIFCFVLGIVVSTVMFSHGIMLVPHSFSLGGNGGSCLDLITNNVLRFDFSEVHKNCRYPEPDHAICDFTVCGKYVTIDLDDIR